MQTRQIALRINSLRMNRALHFWEGGGGGGQLQHTQEKKNKRKIEKQIRAMWTKKKRYMEQKEKNLIWPDAEKKILTQRKCPTPLRLKNVLVHP